MSGIYIKLWPQHLLTISNPWLNQVMNLESYGKVSQTEKVCEIKEGTLTRDGKLTWGSAYTWYSMVLCWINSWGMTIFMVNLIFMQFHCQFMTSCDINTTP